MIKKIGFLTSSRADYGISFPLIEILKNDIRFDLTIIAFGMHLEKKYGETVNEILINKSLKVKKIKCMPNSDSPYDISLGIGKIIIEFSKFWKNNKYDLIIAIGDRFEMFSAVQATIPFEMKLAHIHGGETSLGSTDNIFRDQITLASSLHLTSNFHHSKKVEKIIGNNKNIYNIGSLSLHNLKNLILPNWTDVCEKFKIIERDFVLITFHPETVNQEKNYDYIKVLRSALSILCNKINLVITLSNADTYGKLYNDLMIELKNKFINNIFLVNSFGKKNYFAALTSCKFVLGNSSSALIESASFNKFAINVGNRQLGRIRNKNVIDVGFDKNEIIEKSLELLDIKEYNGINIFQSETNINNVIDKIYEF